MIALVYPYNKREGKEKGKENARDKNRITEYDYICILVDKQIVVTF